jgi:hypothetical protein
LRKVFELVKSLSSVLEHRVFYAIGLSAGFLAVAIYYSIRLNVVLNAPGFRLHHLYYGVAGIATGSVLVKTGHRRAALFLLGVGTALALDGLTRTPLSEVLRGQ